MLALHFGAGNIGKGFIGSLLNKTDYDLCFVDVNQDTIDRFNKKNRYLVELLDDTHTVEVVAPVTALNSLTQEQDVIRHIEQADIITTSVGVNNLPRIAGILAKGLLNRINTNKNKLDVLANENAINASSKLKEAIATHLSDTELASIESLIGFPNTSIDRLALSKTDDDDEIALVEPLYEWVINASEIQNNTAPRIKGARYVNDLKPFIERKLYSVNMAHAATAYLGFVFNKSTIQDTLKDQELEQFIEGTMQETAQYFIKVFNVEPLEMTSYINKTLLRFKNSNIQDDIFRVGRSPIRKLGYNERLVKPLRELSKLGLPISHLTLAIAAGYLFFNPEDEESVTIQNYISEHGIKSAIAHFSELKDATFTDAIIANYNKLKTQKL